MPPLHVLDQARRTNLRILFLAPHAPVNGAAPPPAIDPVFGVQPAYHREIHDLLRDALGLDLVSRNSLDGLDEALDRANFVFSLYNIAPFRNSEVHVASLAAKAGIACLGAPPNIRALAEDKWISKLSARALGIPCPPGQPYGDGHDVLPPAFPGPYIAKPRFGAASAEIDEMSVHDRFEPLRGRVAALSNAPDSCLVEQVAGAFDVTVPVLPGPEGPFALPVACQKAAGPSGVFTHRQKRRLEPGLVREFPGDAPWTRPIIRDALRFARAVQPWDYLRCDFRAGPDGHAFLECNVACSIGSAMAFAQCAEQAGIALESLVEHIIAASLDRQWGPGEDRPPVVPGRHGRPAREPERRHHA